MDAGHPAHDGMQDLLASYFPPLILSYQSSYPIKPFVAKPFSLTSEKSCTLSLTPPHHVEQGIKIEPVRSVVHV